MTKLDKKYNFLRPIKNNNLGRVGRSEDGGYVVDTSVLKKFDNLISFGLGSDWSFELDFIKKKINAKVHVYDHTTDIFIYIKPLIKCFKRFITYRKKYKDLSERFLQLINYVSFINLKNVLFFREKITYPIKIKKKESDIEKAFSRISPQINLILKIDIEGSEYEIIDEIIKYSERIEMLILEFHSLDEKEESFTSSIKKLQNKFDIIHVHGNNHCAKSLSGLPIAIEVTLLSKKYTPEKIEYICDFPLKDLDFPNNSLKKDLFFSFEN
jgi:hypothetical protein